MPPSGRYAASTTSVFPTLSGIYPASWGRTAKQESTPFNFTMTYSPVNTTTDRDSAVLVPNPNRLSRGSSDAGPPQITIRYEWEPPLPPDPTPPPPNPREGYLVDHDWGKSLAFWASLGVWTPSQRPGDAGPSTAETNNHLLGRTPY
ncbi:hypothetical protein FRC04_003153 [Tulasnella sp. 424]|nr:hypothetical protein FRC04_003153 [Tulasnella sp. 424]KAG8966263.1 hypothetical protein FRC05_002722 [Tulasnella sp. 425]